MMEAIPLGRLPLPSVSTCQPCQHTNHHTSVLRNSHQQWLLAQDGAHHIPQGALAISLFLMERVISFGGIKTDNNMKPMLQKLTPQPCNSKLSEPQKNKTKQTRCENRRRTGLEEIQQE